jgi:N-acetylneuraminic acid mutarotase
MSAIRIFRLLFGGLLVIVALGVGFLAGRRLPHGLLARLRGDRSTLGDWAALPPAPFKVFEAGTIVIEGRVFVFGGFRNARVQASEKVWVFDPVATSWTRQHDMPTVRTHANPVLVGGTVWFAGGFVGDNPGPATDQVWRYDWRADKWSPGPPLPARRGGGALVAVNGKLHYFGGYKEDRNTNSEDHWVLDVSDSLAAAGWARAAPLPKPRGHLSGAVVEGLVYAIGGCDRHDPFPLDVPWVHRYDPATDTWTEVTPLPIPRSHFEPGTLVRNGRIILVGGRSRPTGRGSLDDVTEYDPATNRWRALPPLPEPRHSPIAVLVGDRILVGAGGRYTSDPDTPTFWLERRDGPWQSGPPIPVELGGVSGGVIGGRLFLVGGQSPNTLSLDLGTGRWDDVEQHSARPAPTEDHAAEVWEGRLFLFGGLGRARGVVQIYDPAADRWRFGPDMPFAAASSASAVIGPMIYVAGGIMRDSTTRQAARFDPRREVWTPIAPMPLARNHAAAGTDGHRLFIFGGKGPGSGDSNVVANGFDDVQIYDPDADTWILSDGSPARPAPLPQGRGGAGKAVYVAGEFWVFGGETLDAPGATRDGVFSRVDIYDPVANRWRAGPALPTPRHGTFPMLSGDRVYVFGGGLHSGRMGSTVAEILDLVPRSRGLLP